MRADSGLKPELVYVVYSKGGGYNTRISIYPLLEMSTFAIYVLIENLGMNMVTFFNALTSNKKIMSDR